MLRLRAAEDVAQADEHRAHDATDRWGQGREVRRRRRGRPKQCRRVLGGVGSAVFGAAGQLVRRRATRSGNQRAHFIQAGVQHLVGIGEATALRDPPASRKRGAAHKTRGPDVAVDATLVAKTIGQASLAEQFVKLILVRGRNLAANFGNAGIEVRGGRSFSGHGDADGSEQRVRQFQRRRLGDVKAIDEAVADQVEIA